MDIKYASFTIVIFLARFIPIRMGYFLSECCGDILFLFSSKRRRIVTNNIRRTSVVNENTNRKVRDVFRNSAKNYFDLMKLSRINLHNLAGKVKIDGMHHLTQATVKGIGVIIATAHLGNFEFGAHVIASHGVEMLILVEAYNSSPFLRKLAALRTGNMVRILPVGVNGTKEAIKTLRRGGTVTIVCDRDLTGNGIKTKFFGVETSFPVGVVDLALRTGATIIPIFSLRESNNTSSIFVESPLKLSDIKNHAQALKTNLEYLVAILEKYIRAYPEQWVVLESI